MAEKPSSAASYVPGYSLIVVAMAFVFGVTPGRKGEENKGETGAGPSTPATAVVTGDKKAPGGHIQFLKEKGLLPEAEPYQPVANTRFLILTLPDPIDSQLGYWYDQSIDALTRAMTDLEEPYTLVDRWFPWTIASEDKSKNLIVRAGVPRAEPGVMIYQKSSNANERLVVLVVGENPVTGIAVNALKAALDLALRAPEFPAKPIPLIGPFCTGSQASLGRTVKGWAKDKKLGESVQVVTCITGSALGLKPWDKIWLDEDGAEVEKRCGPIKGTQAPFSELRRVAMHYLSQPGRMDPAGKPDDRPPGRVAYLVEANSGFGGAVATSVVDEIGSTKFGQFPTEGVVYRFPMHIGRLAGMRSKEARERDQRLGLIAPGEGQLLATDANRTGGDLIPSADENRTALINQRLLADYWAEIRRERVRYVWVIATDKRDVLFLIEQIQGACPDAQPVVLGADLHYVHPDYRRFMRGVLVVGTYPLSPPAQRWQARSDQPDPRRLPFPSSNAEGVYNAVLATYGGPASENRKRMVDYRPPFGSDAKNPPKRPAVWVTTIGENGEFVPLAFSTGYDAGSMVPSEGGSAVAPAEPPFQRPFYYLVGIVAIAVGFAAWRVWSLDRRIAPAARAAGGRLWVPGQCAQYVTFVGLGGVFAVLPLALAFWSACVTGSDLKAAHAEGAAAENSYAGFYVAVAALALLAGGVALYVWEQARLTARAVASKAPVPAYAVLAPWQGVALALLIGGSVFGWLLADHSRLPDAARYLFAERAADLYSGCSPVVPAAVIALGLLGTGLLGLQHVRLMTEFRVTAPYPHWGPSPPAGVAAQDAVAVGRIHAAVGEIEVRFRSLLGVFTEPGTRASTRWGRLVGWGTAGAFSAALVVRAVGSDQTGDTVLYSIGVGVAGAAVLAAALILLFVWRHEGRVPVARPRPTGVLLLVAAGTACAVALARAQRTWESPAWNCLFATGLLALAFLTLVAGYRLFLLWKQVEKITRAIAVVPMVGAFDRFPDKVARVFSEYLLANRRRTLDLAIPLHLLEQLRATAAPLKDDEAKAAVKVLPKRPPAPAAGADEMEGTDAAALCGVAAALVNVLAPGWASRRVPDAFGTVGAEPDKEAAAAAAADWRALAEQFIAIMAVIFLSQYFARMRCLAYMAIAPAGTLLIAVTAYQFEPEQTLMYTAVGFAGAVIALLVWLFYRINRNELVSRSTRGTPNKFQLDGAFVQNLAVFVLPLAAVIATQLAGRMRSVVEPVLGWLR